VSVKHAPEHPVTARCSIPCCRYTLRHLDNLFSMVVFNWVVAGYLDNIVADNASPSAHQVRLFVPPKFLRSLFRCQHFKHLAACIVCMFRKRSVPDKLPGIKLVVFYDEGSAGWLRRLLSHCIRWVGLWGFRITHNRYHSSSLLQSNRR